MDALLVNHPESIECLDAYIVQGNFTASVSSGSLGWGNYFPPYYPTHTLPTVYEYNSLNQVMAQASPDGDISRFWYDALGRLVASRNEEQLNPKNTTSNASVNRYSYTVYDAQGRITECQRPLFPVSSKLED